ncbi:MAG: immunity protein YezG family protein [Clostridium sp.]
MISKEKSEGLYQELAIKLNDGIPVDWDKIIVFCEVERGWTSLYCIFYESYTKEMKEMFSLPREYGINRKDYISWEMEIEEIIKEINKAFIEEGEACWTSITFILTSDGKFKADFGYEDVYSSSVSERRAIWAKKYIK